MVDDVLVLVGFNGGGSGIKAMMVSLIEARVKEGRNGHLPRLIDGLLRLD